MDLPSERQEPSLHELILSRTTIPVAEIIAADFSRAHLDRDYLLMTALPGVPLSDAPSLSSDQHNQIFHQIGTYLRQLHELTAFNCLGTRTYGYIGLHYPMEPQSTWAEAFHVMWNQSARDCRSSHVCRANRCRL